MKIAILSIVTENQNSPIKAKKLAGHISKVLGIENNVVIEKYEKLENSYKLDWKFCFENPENSIIESLKKTDMLCSPWTVNLNADKNEIDLTFNKSNQTTFRKNVFNVIVWANFQMAE